MFFVSDGLLISYQVDTAEVSYKQAVVAANEAQEQLMSLHESAFNHIAESAADAGTTCTDVSWQPNCCLVCYAS